MPSGSARPPLVSVAGQVIEFTALRLWPADSAVIMQSSVTYHAERRCDLSTVTCAICLDPVGELPFSVHVMIAPSPCNRGTGHMPCSAVAIHATCEIPLDEELRDTILALVADCSP